MDYKEQAKAVKLCGSAPSILQCSQDCPYWNGGNTVRCVPRMTADAAKAITDLLARAEAAEAAQETLQKAMEEYKVRAAKAEREAEEAKQEAVFCRNGWKKAEMERDAAVQKLEIKMKMDL